MLKKLDSSTRTIKFSAINSALLILGYTTKILAQPSAARVAPPAPEKAEDFTWWYATLFILLLSLAGTIFWWLNSKKAKKDATAKPKQTTDENGYDINALDADKEMEWLRKNQKLVGKKPAQRSRRKKRPSNLPATEMSVKVNGAEIKSENASPNESGKSSAMLPIFSIQRLELARPFDDLPLSNDDDLMNAIEQTQDEFEEDEEIRDLTLRILAAFRTKNSVEALSQIALYDLSSSLRSKAVMTLGEFDHESVFETILLGNADPSREVRAAAARGLTKLTFDRADAWARIAESDEEGRTVHAARAAIESGFVDMSFDRLVHQDRRYAYEAFALMALLIKAGETEKIFGALEKHRDMNVRRAILHTIKITKDQKAIQRLCTLLEENKLPIEFQEEIDKTIEEIGFVTV